MQKKEVLLLLTDHWADWEAAYAITGISMSEDYEVKTIAVDKEPKVSIGGLRTEIDYTIAEYQNFDRLAMVILTGGFTWTENPYDNIAAFVSKAHQTGIPIAAICGATIFLAKHGFLNNVKHTGDDAEYFNDMLEDEDTYGGHAHFVVAQAVNDGGFITANETAALEFAREIRRTLKTAPEDKIDEWYEKYKNGLETNI